jgi:hypothetical protein
MDGWMDGWMSGWMSGWMDGWMDGNFGGISNFFTYLSPSCRLRVCENWKQRTVLG